jgi:hypothetical protein
MCFAYSLGLQGLDRDPHFELVFLLCHGRVELYALMRKLLEVAEEIIVLSTSLNVVDLRHQSNVVGCVFQISHLQGLGVTATLAGHTH